MANKKTTKTTKSKKADCEVAKMSWAKNVIIGVLMAVILCLILGFATVICVLKDRIAQCERTECNCATQVEEVNE